MNDVVAFLAGLIFAIGLGVGGMTQPAKVLAFLDVTGRWDPSLALVMAGAIAVHAPIVRWALRRSAPLCASRFQIPVRRDVDGSLIGGALLFGIGWGLAGYCPGPVLVSLVAGSRGVVLFVAAMGAGMVLARRVASGSRRRHTLVNGDRSG